MNQNGKLANQPPLCCHRKASGYSGYPKAHTLEFKHEGIQRAGKEAERLLQVALDVAFAGLSIYINICIYVYLSIYIYV